jgi:LytS/YehU family sensor histidine kinase
MHGDLKSTDHPLTVKVDVRGNRLYFYCRNKKRTGTKQLSTGIGLDNIKKRLDLAYGENYKFLIQDEQDFYTSELIIDKL